nr:uncharacterized protein YMR317W-like isoform X2 [Leptinotarsa decemlineata]
MQGSTKIPITDINVHITCKICNGYFVDATTIIECLHTFCRSCIVKYLEKNKYCPVCDVQVHKTKPLLNIRPDKTIQDLVYKLVPRLFQNEMQKRRAFYDSHPESKPSSLEQCGEATYQHLLTPEETICLTLAYHGSEDRPRYLRCPAAVSMAHLKKLIWAKYDLSEDHRVDIFYNQDCLNPSLTLMDVAYIYLWKRKGPIELTYRIYERASKKPKLDPEYVEATQMNNNNNWKEVQLRISENGEMSITGIQDSALSPSLMEIVNSELKYKNGAAPEESKPSNKITGKKELPALKYIGKGNSSTTSSTTTSTAPTTVTNIETTTKDIPPKLKIDYKSITLVPPNTSGIFNSCVSTVSDSIHMNIAISTPLSVCATFSSAATTTVYSTINSSKCSTKSEELISSASSLPSEMSSKQGAIEEKLKPSSPPTANDGTCDKNLKRKNIAVVDTEPPAKQPKQTILNHSLGLQNLSNNHPLKKHSKLNRNGENVKEGTLTKAITSESELLSSVTNLFTTTTSETTVSKANLMNKSGMFAQSQSSKSETPVSLAKSPVQTLKPSTVSAKSPLASYGSVKPPCYMPKSSYNPIINVPKPVTSNSLNHNNCRSQQDGIASSSLSPGKSDGSKPATTSSSQPQQQISIQNSNSKLSIKTKPSSPIGYKTLRDPPKSWNSQISKANLTKSSPEPKYSDLKNVRPAKFFKMRNNMPRYLGNPASGVKPMYQLHVNPEKEKNKEATKTEKSEIKKHSIVKIDPKTLRPVSEKAPEMTSLSNHSANNQNLSNRSLPNQNYSNQSLNSSLNTMAMHGIQNDLKINTSSVSIFSPLKLQSSPKNERKSPKSPHSPKPKTTSSPTGTKREKMNLNFTPSNPFIPNLTSTTLSPNQFLYPTAPPGFPAYDPRVMAAYHNIWYGQRMPFPTAPLPGLSLDLNQQRKNLDMLSSPTSPKMGALSQQMHNNQVSSRPATTTSNISSISRTHNLIPSPNTYKPPTSSKKSSRDSKNEKSLENAVEKLTQNRHKAIGAKNEISISSNVLINSGIHQKEKSGSKQKETIKASKDSTLQQKSGSANESEQKVRNEANSCIPASSSSAPSQINVPQTHPAKNDAESNVSNSSEKNFPNSSSDNMTSSSMKDSPRAISNDNCTNISKTFTAKQNESSSENNPSENKSSVSTENKKFDEAVVPEQVPLEIKSEIKVEVSEMSSSGVSTKTSSDSTAVKDISVSVNKMPCTFKVDERVMGSNFKQSVKNNDSQYSEELAMKGNGLC